MIDDSKDQWKFPDDGTFETAFPFLDFDRTEYSWTDTIMCRIFPERNLRAVLRRVDNMIYNSQSSMRNITICLERVDNLVDKSVGSSMTVDSSKG